jgi:tetratricopeptide (TPR) repeat protein
MIDISENGKKAKALQIMVTKSHTLKVLPFIFIMFFLNNCANELAFEKFPNTLVDRVPAPIPSYADIKKEIRAFSKKLEKKESRNLNADFITEGLLALAEKKFVQANKSFQHALKYEPQNAMLHKLNALAHQLRGDAGNPEHYKMAEVGYSLASRLDPGDSKIHYFIGILQFKQLRYKKAQEHFATAIIQDPNQAEYFMGLAASSYYLGELDRAYANIGKALSLKPNHPSMIQASGVIYASLGAFDKANLSSDTLGTVSKLRQDYLQQRITDWEAYYNRNKIKSDEQIKTLLAQNLDIFGVPKGGMFDSTDTNTDDPQSRNNNGNLDSVDSQDVAPKPSQIINEPATPVTKKAIPGTKIFPISTPQVKDSTKTVKAKTSLDNEKTAKTIAPIKQPAKKKIKIPRMAMVDVAIIRTEEVYKTAKGVNLLDGLNIFFAADQLYKFQKPFGGKLPTTPTGNDAATLKLGTGGNGITYSLNIFSDNYDRNEVIARPTILVEDQKKSSFYAGGTLHIVVEGGVAGSGAMQPLPTGVKLEVTPKFLDEDTIDFSVYAERAFLEASLSQVSDTVTGTTFATTTKTSIAANLTLRYGETMILSGLSDMEKESLDDKAPFLGEVPLLQYMFRRQTKTASKKTILILITPRRASLKYEDGSSIKGDTSKSNGSIDKLEKNVNWMRPASNLKSLVAHLGKYEFFNHYRRGDMQLDNWSGEGAIEDAILRTLDYLYIYYDFEKNEKSEL